MASLGLFSLNDTAPSPLVTRLLRIPSPGQHCTAQRVVPILFNGRDWPQVILLLTSTGLEYSRESGEEKENGAHTATGDSPCEWLIAQGYRTLFKSEDFQYLS